MEGNFQYCSEFNTLDVLVAIANSQNSFHLSYLKIITLDNLCSVYQHPSNSTTIAGWLFWIILLNFLLRVFSSRGSTVLPKEVEPMTFWLPLFKNSLSLASDSGSEDVFCLFRTVLLPPSPTDGCPVEPGVPGPPVPAK